MNRVGLTLAAACMALASPSHAREPSPTTVDDGSGMISSCINAAATAHRLPPSVIVILLNVEGGKLGHVSQNTNDTVDIGPMQINQIWIPAVSRHWRASATATRAALLNNFCANVEAGAWILRTAIDEAKGDFWEGVGFYHSHADIHKTTYLRLVLRQVLRLQTMVARETTARTVASVGDR